MDEVNKETTSQMMSRYSKMRKRRYLTFKENPELARKAGKAGALKRWKGHEQGTTQDSTEQTTNGDQAA